MDNKYIARIKPSSAELIAISDFNQKDFERNHMILLDHVILVGIKSTDFLNGNDRKDISILGIGSLIPLKQYHLFIEIIYEIRHFFPEIKAVLCGKGPEQQRLKKAVEENNLEANFELS